MSTEEMMKLAKALAQLGFDELSESKGDIAKKRSDLFVEASREICKILKEREDKTNKYVKGDILELEDGKICTVVQVQEKCYVCLEGVCPLKDKPAEKWPFCNVRESRVLRKVGKVENEQ